MIKKNIGTPGRLFRLSIAIVLLGYAWWQWSLIALILGLFTLYEAVASWCVIYQILGKNYCPRDRK